MTSADWIGQLLCGSAIVILAITGGIAFIIMAWRGDLEI